MDCVLLREHLLPICQHFRAHDMRSDWWENIILYTWDGERWLQNFCMCQAIFMDIVIEVVPNTEWQDSGVRSLLTSVKNAAITIWKLATSFTANQFNLGKPRLEQLSCRCTASSKTCW